MGIDGFWIGYEGTRSGYAKQQGRPVEDILTEFREHGITILTSMIVGFDYQNPEVVAQELDGLMKLKPALAQFLIYGPVPGTPFYERVIKENLLQDVLHQRQGLVLPAGGRVHDDDQTPDAFARGDRGPAALVFRGGFPAARPEHLPRAGSAVARLPEAQELTESSACARRPSTTPRNCGRPTRCFSPAGCSAPTPPCGAGSATWSGASTRSWAAPRCGERFKSVLAVGAALWTGPDVEAGPLPASQADAHDVSDAGQALGGVRSVGGTPSQSLHSRISPSRSSCNTPEQQVWMRLEGSAFRRGGRGSGAAHPRFPGAEQEPPGAGPEEAPLGQGGRPASAGREAGRLSLPHPPHPAQAGGGASRGDPARQHVSPLQGLKGGPQGTATGADRRAQNGAALACGPDKRAAGPEDDRQTRRSEAWKPGLRPVQIRIRLLLQPAGRKGELQVPC